MKLFLTQRLLWIIIVLAIGVITSKSSSFLKEKAKGNEEDFATKSLTSSKIPWKYREWQQHLDDELPLNKIAIPGTHNSMTFLLEEEQNPTQIATVITQLNVGVRFLDFRLCLAKEETKDPYQTWDFCMDKVHAANNYHLGDVLELVIKWLEINRSEFIFVRIKNENNEDQAKFDSALNEIFNNFLMKYLYLNGFYQGSHLKIPKVGDVRRRIILSVYNCKCPDKLPNCLEWKSKENFKSSPANKMYTANGLRSSIFGSDEMCVNDYMVDRNKKDVISYYMITKFTAKLWLEDTNYQIAKEINPVVQGLKCNKGIYLFDYPGINTVDFVIKWNPSWTQAFLKVDIEERDELKRRKLEKKRVEAQEKRRREEKLEKERNIKEKWNELRNNWIWETPKDKIHRIKDAINYGNAEGINRMNVQAFNNTWDDVKLVHRVFEGKSQNDDLRMKNTMDKKSAEVGMGNEKKEQTANSPFVGVKSYLFGDENNHKMKKEEVAVKKRK